jgi:hypothetical protein
LLCLLASPLDVLFLPQPDGAHVVNALPSFPQ